MIMRKRVSKIFGDALRYLAIETRERLGITQNEMGERLCMSESSYSDIERGKSHCGMATALLLLDMQADSDLFIRECVRKAIGEDIKEMWRLSI